MEQLLKLETKLKLMKKLLFLLLAFVAPSTYGQSCSGCTMNINGTTTLDVNVYPGNVLCIQSGGEVLGDIFNYGGTVCNEGLISGDYIQYSGTLNNYNQATSTSQSIINEGVVNNYQTINSFLMAVHGSSVTINNFGTLSPDELDMTGDSLSQTSVLYNHGTVLTTNFHTDTSTIFNYGSFYTTESIHVNDLAFFHSYGILEAGLNYYNNGFTELYCMAVVNGDLYNNGESSGPPFGCGGFSVDGNAFNNGNYGTNNLALDLCKTSGPSGFDGSLGTIGPNVTYCSCSNACSTQTATVPNLENPDDEKYLVKIIDLTGREVEPMPNTLLIYLYSDGSSEKVFQVELK
jgi:hypothetical protein